MLTIDLLASGRITKTPGVCGGAARVGTTRLAVWSLVLAKKMGQSDAALLDSYPTLTAANLDDCWEYYRQHPTEIEQLIWLNDTVGNIPEGELPPASVILAGQMLGLTDDEVMAAFSPPLTPPDISAAWQQYRSDPVRVSHDIARTRMAG